MANSPLPLQRILQCGACALVLSGCATFRGGDSHTAAAGRAGSALSIDMPVGAICASPDGRAVLDRDLPGLSTHPDFAMFKSMSLKTLAAMSNGKITPSELAKVQADLAALPPSP